MVAQYNGTGDPSRASYTDFNWEIVDGLSFSTDGLGLPGYEGAIDAVLLIWNPGFPTVNLNPYIISPPDLIAIGVGAGGTVLTGTKTGDWTIATDSASTDIGSLVRTACGFGPAGDGSYAPDGAILPIRFNGAGTALAWVNGNIVWEDGHVDYPYNGCCNDTATGVYALSSAGDLYHCTTEGGTFTLVLSGAMSSGDNVLVMQTLFDGGGVAFVHGQSGAARLTIAHTGTPWTKTDYTPFAWPTSDYLDYTVIVPGTGEPVTTYYYEVADAAVNA